MLANAGLSRIDFTFTRDNSGVKGLGKGAGKMDWEMDWETVLNSLDKLVFQETGKHLDSLQVLILEGVLKGQKYAEIAQEYKCTMGHVRDESYKLWRLLSKVLGEDIKRSNFCATLERLGIVNCHSKLVNPVQIAQQINVCPNSQTLDLDDFETISNQHPLKDSVEQVLRETKLETIPKLVKLGLRTEQIAEVLNLPLAEVEKAL